MYKMKKISSIFGMVVLIYFGILLSTALAGIPEPGIVLYGHVRANNGSLITSGVLTWTFTPSAGKTVTVTTQLRKIKGPGGPFSYAVQIPMEKWVTGYPVAKNTIPASSAPISYTRSAKVAGTNITTTETVDISAANRGTIMCVPFGTDDADGDGMPDNWEMKIVNHNLDDAITSVCDVMPGDDYDQDGVTNLNEYLNGTNPTVGKGAPIVSTRAATSVGATSATLNGAVNPHGFDTSAWFEFGLDKTYGSKTTTISLGSGDTGIAVSRNVNKFTALMTYHYRIAAQNSAGKRYGKDKVFTTTAAQQHTINSSVGSSEGSINPEGKTISSVNAYGGTINPEGTIQVNHGTDKSFAIEPRAGYTIAKVAVDGSSVGITDTHTFTSVTEDHTIAAYFKKAVDMIGIGDINTNGTKDMAVLRVNVSDGINNIYIKDGHTGENISTLNFGSSLEVIDMDVAPDLSGNSVPEIAVLLRNIDTGSVTVQLRDPLTGALVKNIAYASSCNPIEAVVINDINNNGYPEIGVIGEQSGTGKLLLQLRDMSTGVLVRNNYYDLNFRPVTAVVLPDIEGTGYEEVGLLGEHRVSGEVRMELLDSATGLVVRSIKYFDDSAYTPVGAAVIADTNGNKYSEIGVLGVNKVNGSVLVQIRDTSDGALVRDIVYNSAYAPYRVLSVNDSNKDGYPEAGVLGVSESTGEVLFQLKDTVTKQVLSNLFFDKTYVPVKAVIVPDLNNNTFEEVAVVGEDPVTGKVQVNIIDCSTGSLVNSIDVP